MASASYRCTDRSIVNEGDMASEVKLKCGNPIDIQDLGQVEKDGKLIRVESWTYNPGSGKLYKILEFENGVLTKINTGSRVP